MDILVVGSGGREHALIKKLKESPSCGRIICAPGNGGIAAEAETADVKATNIQGMVALAKEKKVGLAVIAPDDPLVLGMADAMEEEGIPAFGPSRLAARLEGSKLFAKNLMKEHGIPTANFVSFDRSSEAAAYIRKNKKYPIVVKADGLALGKGVLICQDEQQALDAVASIMEEKRFGRSGDKIVVEEYLTGPEVSVLCLTDGKTIKPMVSSMDHKRAYNDDAGPNTGGMGTIAPNPYYTEEIAETCMQRIFLPTIRAMQELGCPFKGCLYFGLMLTEKGPYVIEYNCRFGDPETQVVLPLLEGDLIELMLACRNGNLDQVPMSIKPGAAACVVMASGGYPGKYATGLPITGLDAAGGCNGVSVVHAGTRLDRGKFYTAGGRVLGIVATGDSLQDALLTAYAATTQIQFPGRHFRQDIGRKAVRAK